MHDCCSTKDGAESNEGLVTPAGQANTSAGNAGTESA
jgi:hypothetical protein